MRSHICPTAPGTGTWLRRYDLERGPRSPATATDPPGAGGPFAGVQGTFCCRVRVGGEIAEGMDRFVSTYTNKIDAKGRVSIPASFRAVLERDGYAGGIYCYPSLDAEALDAGGERLAQKIDGLLAGLPDYSDERDELSVALYGDVQILTIDGDGRIVLPEGLRRHAGLQGAVTFVGLGDKFQMWEPGRFEQRRGAARAKVQGHRKLFAAGSARPSGDGDEGARE